MGTPYAININAGWRLPVTQLLCKEPPYGGIRAIDLLIGGPIWDRPLGDARSKQRFYFRSGSSSVELQGAANSSI